MTTQRFDELLQKYKTDLLTEGEWVEMRLALQEGSWEDALEDDMRQVFSSGTDHKGGDETSEARIWSQVKARCFEQPDQAAEKEGPARIIRLPRRRWLWWSAAAVLLLLIAGGYILFSGGKDSRQTAASAAMPIAPGRNKAWLTLANGTHVILDDAGSGNIASQGGVNVIKLDSGLLAYRRDAGGDAGVVFNTITTPRGGQYQLILQDGTHVWLNAASSLRFPTAFAGKDRQVELTGEGYFEVKHIASRPFRVKVGQQLVEDIGTAFNINAYTDEDMARTSLIEGAVKVSVSSDAAGAGVMLKPGQQAQFPGGKSLSVANNVDIEQVVAWKNGQIAFTNADFSSLMRQISRWYDIDVHYTGAVPKKRFFGLLDRNVYLSAILEYLQANGIHIKQEGRVITVSP
ncbi:MAG: FecR domain-containing protein [Chitinophagaceae bacterium]|nr:FecR domain-containing protein [Chitinophagaceae bacterium]